MATRVLSAKFAARTAMALLTAVPFLAAAPLAEAGPASPLPGAGPVKGGTLKIVAAAGPDHLDTVPAYFSGDFILERTYARQLVSYRTVPDPSVSSRGWKTDLTPVPDVATVVPTSANGGISDGGKVYTFHLKQHVDWNTTPARQVTSADFLREFKVFCNPAPGGFVGNLKYYTSTIVGMNEFCQQELNFFGKPRHHVTAGTIAKFQNTHAIAGITAVNSLTIRFRLLRPASDFLNLLALPFASARPVEYDSYLPNSLQLDEHTISDGPYQIVSYVPGRSIVMEKNPGWRQSTDSIRHQFVRQITVTEGITNARTQITDLRKGLFDLMLDTALPVSQLPSLRKDAAFRVWPGDSLSPYLTLNLRSPHARHAMASVEVRRAIEFGVDKAAVQNVLGGPAFARILNSAEPPGNLGALSVNPYPSAGSRGSIASCRAELARSGKGKNLALRFAFISDAQQARLFAALQASLKRCGINLIPDPLSFSKFFSLLLNARKSNKAGTFDLAMVSWLADWSGNNGRSILDPLLRTHCVDGTFNFGCFSDHKVDQLITQAETTRSFTGVAKLWAQANRQVMADAALVPLIDARNPILASSRVREAGLPSGVVFGPAVSGPDLTQIWIKKRR
jgi:peptide/nickel transport system substrate-binding protein